MFHTDADGVGSIVVATTQSRYPRLLHDRIVPDIIVLIRTLHKGLIQKKMCVWRTDLNKL